MSVRLRFLVFFLSISAQLMMAIAEVSTALAATESAKAPLSKLVLPNPLYDFGTVLQGTTVEHAFEIRNSGTTPLKIERVHTSCGCTAAILESDTINPGQQTMLKATFDTTGFQGSKVKTIRVFTNDPQQASAVLTLQGRVQAEVDVDPARLYFGDVPKGTSPSMSTLVLVPESSTVNFLDVSAKSNNVTIVTEDVKTKSRYGKRITISLSPSIPVGVFREQIVVKTSSEKTPVVILPVFARIQGMLMFTPSNISFGLLEGPLEKPLSQTVTLSSRAEKPISILSVESDNPFISAEHYKTKNGREAKLTVTIKNGLSGTFRARIKVTTDSEDPEEKQLFLPVYGIVSRKGQ